MWWWAGDSTAATRFQSAFGIADQPDALIEPLDLDGLIQVASFDPCPWRDGIGSNATGDFSDRSPDPVLHLLRLHT